MFQKNNNSLNQLLATAFVLLCAQPEWLFSLGFQLSFVAVLSLILFYKWVYKWISPANKIAALLWSVVAASIAAVILSMLKIKLGLRINFIVMSYLILIKRVLDANAIKNPANVAGPFI